ncbi:MAG: L,D-transpeptidase family protein [Thalassovita sp.]
MALVASLLISTSIPGAATAQVTAFKQAVAEYASDDRDLAAFYRDQTFGAVWIGADAVFTERRKALLNALKSAESHGLSASRYDVDGLMAQMAAAKTSRDMGILDVELSKTYLKYARDVQYGMLKPTTIDDGIKRKAPSRPALDYLTDLLAGDADQVMAQLPPQTGEYPRLRKEMLRLQALMTRGGWGETVSGKKLEPGDKGANVVKLRNRLVAMGYLTRTATQRYDARIEAAVQQFQTDHGLEADGVAGATTITELNVPVQKRLQSVLVAMERERWTNMERGDRHVLVNLTDYTAKIFDDGKVTFRTRSVVGQNVSDRRSPEFSDIMEHMIINPTWHVPRSIAVNEYLPMMKKNPNAAGHLRLVNGRGQSVSREGIDFTQYTARTFPFDIKQPPSNRNALGLVKFMFPNKHNIYLHDTPAKNLFSRETRAYSHGCIRLAQPFDFAYALLAVQSDDPKGDFHRHLNTGRETKVDLVKKVPVHIIYRTATVPAKGKANYRRDVYGRDARVWNALQQAGVALDAVSI